MTKKVCKNKKDVKRENSPSSTTPKLLTEVKKCLRSFMSEFSLLESNYPDVSLTPPSVDLFIRLLTGADILLKVISTDIADAELAFFVQYGSCYVNDILRKRLCKIAACTADTNTRARQFREELFRRRNELPTTNSFRRIFIESYIDTEVFVRFYENKVVGVYPSKDLKDWDKYFNALLYDYGELSYKRYPNNVTSNTALEVIREKIAINFSKI